MISDSRPQPTPHRWLQRTMALLALLNLLIVFFDLSYLPLREAYLQVFPRITQVYDPIKGIEPHPQTQQYLSRVDALQEDVRQAGLQASETEALLGELRSLSQQLVLDNPFEGAGRGKVLAKVERDVGDRVGIASGLAALEQFWSQDYLTAAGWQTELDFFDQTLRPLIAANYYRDVDRYGRYVDRFWWIDLPFIGIFALDILIRTSAISRRRPDLNWIEAILRRWYDLVLLLPVWRWLRLLPVTVRLYQTQLLNLNPLRAQLSHDFAINFAGEMMEMMGTQVIDQMQDSIHRGDVTQWLFEPASRRPYVQVNNTNEIQAIATRLLTVSVYDVLPKIQPDIEALVRHTINSTLNQVPGYRQLETIPGVNHLPNQITDRLARTLSEALYGNLTNLLEDPVGTELSTRLGHHFRNALEDELKKSHHTRQLQDWLVDLLEEIKVNYVNRIAESDLEQLADRVERLERLDSRAKSRYM